MGPAYQTSLETLRGVAIRVEDSSPRKQKEGDRDDKEVRLWKYFPADKLPISAEQRFQALFAAREQWSLEDLEPYLDGLVKDTGLSQAEILLLYTTHILSPKKTKDGMTAKLYSAKC